MPSLERTSLESRANLERYKFISLASERSKPLVGEAFANLASVKELLQLPYLAEPKVRVGFIVFFLDI